MEFKSETYQYMFDLVKIMRLFKEGDISLPLEYRFHYKNGVPHIKAMAEPISFLPKNRFSLNIDEFPRLQELLNTIELPLKSKFKELKLAFENFQLSYSVNNPQLQFLTLMNCMEVLFHPSGEGELRYRISRNFAVLLGDEEADTQSKYKKMRNFYDIRSDIVHRGQSDITYNDVLELRHYVRESIKEIYRMNKNKDELLQILNSSGFGTKI